MDRTQPPPLRRSCGWRLLFLGLVLVAGTPLASFAAAEVESSQTEDEVRAAALFNIVLFTEWPASSFASPEAPLVVGVLGEGPTAALLTTLGENDSWHGHPIRVMRFQTPAEIASCHVLYLARSAFGDWARVQQVSAGRSILTASSMPDFARRGGMVEFGVERNRLRLTVNLDAARAGRVTLSSSVLRLARVLGSAR